MRFPWIRTRGVVAVSAAVMALQGVPALAQFVPYGGSPNQGYNQYQAHTAQQAQPRYAQPQHAQPPYAQPQYTAMAYQGSDTRALSQPVESIGPGAMQGSAPMHNYSAAPAPAANCAPAATAPMSYESYPSSGGSATGPCGNYNTFSGGGCGVGAPYGGCNTGGGYGGGYLGAGLGGRGCGRQWFGGFYGLYMERDGNPWKALAFSTPNTNTPPYYPADTEFVVNLNDIDNDTFGGAEVRFGSTFGGGGCGSACGGCGPRHAWETAYWGLVEDTSTFVATDLVTDANRLYGMIDYRGLEYDPGTGYRPVNHYFDYGPPTTDYTTGGLDEIQVRSITARNTFSLQNVEVNLLRLSLNGGGYYSAAAGGAYGGGRGLGLRGGRGGCGAGYGGCDGGSCGVGGCDSCAGGSCGVGCATGCASRYSITGVAGFRYIRMDEDFMFRTDYENVTTPGTGFLAHNIDVDSHLYGAQFGCNAIYRCGCSGRWALHCNTVVGVFNNHVEVWNRMDAPTGGNVRYANGTNADFDIRYEDDDIALLGELRAGASYQYSCNWRLFGGYRLFGLSGAALAFDQIAPSFITPGQTSYVDSDGSIFLHGLQGGIECTY